MQDSLWNQSGAEFKMIASRHFAAWLYEQQVSLAFTHPPLKLFLIGLHKNGELSIFERTFPRCLGIAAHGTDTLFLSSRHQIWQLENSLPEGQLVDDTYDKQYIPRKTYVTGGVGTHDVAVDHQGQVLFVNTRFGCIARVSDDYSFAPIWRPKHLASLPDVIPGDRCHLNGLAMKAGRPAYVTSVSETSHYDGWRDNRKGAGVVIDVATDEVVCRGLSMPHSPRWYRDRLWITNSGTGELGRVDFMTKRFDPIAFAPGFLRGLCLVGNYAVVGSSKPREGDIYSGLGLDEALAKHKAQPRLGLFVIDLNSGKIVHWLFIESEMREIYDVVALPKVRTPMAIGTITDEIEKTIYYDSRLA